MEILDFLLTFLMYVLCTVNCRACRFYLLSVMFNAGEEDQANRRQKLGWVWRNRKKISQIINDYIYLPFFLLFIL